VATEVNVYEAKTCLSALLAAVEVGEDVRLNDVTPLPLTRRHALGAGDLPMCHRDPVDRLLVAQAVTEDVPLMTADPLLSRYEARLVSARR
jgi:PIN domain nuclease of toxin-antitoxin system